MRLAARRPWSIQLRMVASKATGDRTNATRLATAFTQGLTAFRGGIIQRSPGVDRNPWPRVVEHSVLGVAESTIQLSVTLQSETEFDTADVARIFFEAIKSAGNPGLSTTRLMASLPRSGNGCGYVDSLPIVSFFTSGEYVVRVCVDATPASPQSSSNTPPETSLRDSTFGTTGSAVVRDSTVPTEIGLPQRTLGERFQGGTVNLWDEIPLGVKVAGGVAAALAALAIVGYTYRSFK